MNLRIDPLPIVSFVGLPAGVPPQMAENNASITLTGNERGGVFTIAPITSNIGSTTPSPTDKAIFDPSAVTLGPNFITYTFTNSNVCTSSDTQQVIVNPVTTVDFNVQGAIINTSNEFEICGNQGDVKLVGFPAASTGGAPETKFTSEPFYIGQVPLTVVNNGVDYFIKTDGVPSDNYLIRYTYKNAFSAITFKIRSIRILASPTSIISVANSCIKDAIVFNDASTLPTSPFTTSIVSWNWSFGTGESGSSLQNPRYKYSTSGLKDVSLKVTTSQGCANTANKAIRVGDVPVVDFKWSSICNNDFTNFTDKTNPGSISVITKYTWNFGDGDILSGVAGGTIPAGTNGGRTKGTFKNPDHKYSAFGNYNAKLTTDTNDGCNNSYSQQVFILVYSTVTPIATAAYTQDFEKTNGGWKVEDLDYIPSIPSDTSWVWGPPKGTVIKTSVAGNNVWWTGRNSNTYFQNENSVVNGPCFNLTQLKRPMISLDYWSDTEKNVDGAVLQYSIDGGSNWRIIGPPEGQLDRNEGIEWYNGIGIPSNPGEQSIGNYGWTDKIAGWKSGRFHLDMIPPVERDQVRLRIAFASNDANQSGNTYDGFAFDNVFVGEKSRNVLVEHFTNSNSKGSLIGDTQVNKLYQDQITFRGTSDFYDIQYHISSPTSDPLNTDNPTDPASRSLYMGVSQPPSTIMDGILDGVKFKGDYTDFNMVEFDRRALTDPQFDLRLDTIPTGNNNKISVKLTMRALKSINTPLIVQVALIENQTGTFKNVLRKQLLGSDGETITLGFNKGDILFKTRDNVEINVPITNPGQLTLVGYVQDKNTKEIYQSIVMSAPYKKGGVIVGLEPEIIPTTLNGISLYPNPANGSFYMGIPEGKTGVGFTWKLIDQRGIILKSGDFDELINNTKQVDVTGLANGIYLVMLAGPGKSVVYQKIVVMNRN